MLECDTSWQEDEEPQPATIDAWAQGAVPIKIVSKRQLASSASQPVPEKATQTQHKTSNTTSEFDGTTRTGKSTTSTCKPSAASQASGQSERKPKEIAGEVNRGRCEPPRDGKLLEVGTGSRKKKQTKPGKSKKREACAERVSNDSLEDGCRKAVMPHVCKSDTQLCMECGSKVEASSSRNKPLQFTRLNPERFPTNRVKTSFDIADHAVAAHARGRVLKPLPRADVNPHRTKLVKLPPPPAKMARRLVTAAAPFRQPRDELVTPLPPPLLESMELAAGVSVKEGMRMKAGPQVALCSHPSIAENHLRPLCSRVAPVLEIQELLRRQHTVTHVPCIPPITASKT
ncbi:PREDICTED: uncharacterized protein LOC106809044 isoform X2 [Priapulus caudatus]|nr:PREDICTED: uncharacterized protein LOC106809044 isoform X2 [Priapulus caudatus]